ncbi:MAG TPA: hypothetical protein VEA99_05410 [Gemmatimonadaceae bacterium]|nr:hypothetical protein [Gemmatimonadaceae bacterium]
MTRTRLLSLGALTASLVLASAADAQLLDVSGRNRGPSRLAVNAGLAVAQPVGEFGRYVDAGFGMGAGASYALDTKRILSLRGDIGFVVYGSETQRVPIPGIPRVRVDVNTTNSIFTYTVGPQLMAPSGPVRPYAHGFIGGSYFSTSSSLSGSSDYDAGNYFSTQHSGDGVFAYGGEGGLLFPLAVRQTPVAIDIGARYTRNGVTRYLTEGDIQDNADNTVSYTPKNTATNFWLYRVGVRVGVR